jgi:molybdate transport system substrate-binding protein
MRQRTLRAPKSLWLPACVLAAAMSIFALSCKSPSGDQPGASSSSTPDGKAKPTVTVFAASSTTDVVTTLAKQFEAEHGAKLRLNFASSSTLARQIEAGASADIFFSADQEWMDYLQQRGLIQTSTRWDVVGNTLVLVAPADNAFDLPQGLSPQWAAGFSGRLAVGDPGHVPVGKYAKEALENLGLYDGLKARLIPTESARSALMLVERGEVAAGIVYSTDAKASAKVKVVATFPESSHKPIRYPIALCKGASRAAAEFLTYLGGPDTAAVFSSHGFIPLSGPGAPSRGNP